MFRNVNKFHSGMVYFSSRSVVQYGHKSKMVTVESLKKSGGLIEWYMYIKIMAYSTESMHIVHSYDILWVFSPKNISSGNGNDQN